MRAVKHKPVPLTRAIDCAPVVFIVLVHHTLSWPLLRSLCEVGGPIVLTQHTLSTWVRSLFGVGGPIVLTQHTLST
jgi:hypothetical protein